ncbi:MAG TPA: family 20 glycosylhydrolase [Candidatus Limiplasma sp.]|nr:family 20 glycosylhydrolase [Candidatus Limiplasma sp.]
MEWNMACAGLRGRMFGLAGCQWNGTIAYRQREALRVMQKENSLVIEAPDLSGIARGLYQAGCALRSGGPMPAMEQKRHFASCGAMLDMSRGGVMTVASVKRYIDYQAALGLNLLMLYTEDVYPVEEYPYLGYLRGRYTREELRELDEYAAQAGVELVPCIQTLAHLAQFLQWEENAALRDNDDCILIDEPATYRFIEACIASVKQCFRSRRIHIGMDEAHGVGLGRFLEKHGVQDRFALLNRHLQRVVALCEKQGLRPIMWSDMFYRLGSKTNDYYDPEAVIPAEAAAGIPNVALCYWDYYHTDEGFYAAMLQRHKQLNREIVFAGGIWTWSGFLPHVALTDATAYPALRACLHAGIGTVLATQWGDDGCETNYFLALNQLAVYSEHCWLGDACTPEAVRALGARLTGLDPAAYEAFGAFYADAEDHRTGKGLFYCDPLYPLTFGLWDLRGYADTLAQGLAVLQGRRGDPRCDYAWLLLAIAQKKLAWIEALRPAYKADDRAKIRYMAQTLLPELCALYEQFFAVFRAQWEAANKRNGWEAHCFRIGGILKRLEDAQLELLRWADGETAAIEALEEEPRCALRRGGRQDYPMFTSVQYQ